VVITLAKLYKVIFNKLSFYFIFYELFCLVVPHITDAIQEWVERVARISVDEDKAEPDICIIEV
jgi:CTP synthase